MKTEVIKIDREKPDRKLLKRAAKIVRGGGLVAFPTETVYGIAADYKNKKAIEKLYRIKKRPKDKPFTVHISKMSELKKLSCQTNVFSRKLIKKFWPGPLTLIFESENGKRIGVRMPANKIARDFISLCKTQVVAPSANISGNKPPRRIKEVLKDLDGKIDLLIDGGETEVGMESTVLDISSFPYRVLRKGAIDESCITDVGRHLQRKRS